jgi:hypothetical protein
VTGRITLPDVSDDEDRLLNRLLEQLDYKAARNILRAEYYDMRHFTELVGSVIPPQYWRLGIVLGWAAKAVDILTRRCNLEGFIWPDGTLADLGYSEVWDGNALASEVDQALTSSLIHACAFVVNTLPTEDDEPPALIHFKGALNATGDWNGRRRHLDNLLSVTDRDPDGKPTALALYLDGETIVAENDGSGWSVDRQQHAWGVPAEPLVYRPRLGRPMGSSRISRAVMSLQNQATRSVIRLEAHSDIYAIPDMWLLGADQSIFKNADGTLKAAWQIMMGRLKAVPDDDEAANPRPSLEQFPASDPEPHLKSLRQTAQFFSGETSIPLTSLGVSDMSNPTSADAYVASREDLIAEAEGATDDWRPALRKSMVRALAMANGVKAADVPSEWATIDTHWRSPLYLSRAAQADAGTKQISGAPWLAETEVGLELLGLDEQQIARALADKRRAQGSGILQALRDAAATRTAPGGAQ